ncbi:hypothetical protein K435DRAFT_865801 [Dendrothele bispora CBS 962.96]|uniref:Uncharacterized protein n=1 Tax=Dendrothele bispora (strain CBS 962.96) TaxID=1314807 RepID=A0A4S8LIP1_DENBC|nr:hypothetical protein K435DRAFT_865801 [Dendrothele bispora CBS 962.96]
MDEFLVSSVHPASAKRQLANYLQLVTPITTRANHVDASRGVLGLTFVALSRVKDLGGLMILDSLDYSRVKNLGGAALIVTHAHMRSEQNGPCTVYISLREAETAEEQSDDARGEAPPATEEGLKPGVRMLA